jgi:hypothetical protein
MTKKWEEVKAAIERYYVVQRRPLEEVRRLMIEAHDFSAS